MKLDPFPGVLTAQFVDRPFTTKLGKAGCQRVKAWVLTDEQRAWLCKWFPEEENSRLMKMSGMSHSTLHRFAREFGLTKSLKGIKRIKKRQTAQVRKTCQRNGFYDSIRGKKPSEATLEGARRMWQDIREGKREHPFSVMKRENPRKYRKFMQTKSRVRKEQIRKEQMRVLYGMERKTRLKCVVMCPYTRRQVGHRYNALRRGYIIMEDCSEQGGERYNIYYDKDTERAPVFEKNLQKDGFKILEWQNK